MPYTREITESMPLFTGGQFRSGSSWIQLRNRYYDCPQQRRAVIRISESSNNPQRLLFCCDACKYFEWWSPDATEWRSIREYAEERTRTYRVGSLHLAALFLAIIVGNLIARAMVVYLWWSTRTG
ncbi:hypothetical protein WN943_006454 [Citrus x changshan-huyou]